MSILKWNLSFALFFLKGQIIWESSEFYENGAGKAPWMNFLDFYNFVFENCCAATVFFYKFDQALDKREKGE